MDKKLILLVFVFILVFATFTGSIFMSRQDRDVRASKRVAVTGKSICLASALSVAVGQSTQINCIARDAEANAVAGTQCCFSVVSGSGVVAPQCSTTDTSGIAKTSVSAQSVGTSQIDCKINNSVSAGSVTIAFTQ